MSQPCIISLKNGETCVEGTHQNITYLQNQIRQLLGVDASVPLNKIKLVEDKEASNHISPEIRNAIKVLHPSIDVDDLTDESLISNDLLCLKHLANAANFKKPAITGFTYKVCEVSLIVAAFLVEVLGVSKINPHKVDKNFLNNDTVYTLYLPIPIPVCFHSFDEENIHLLVSNSTTIPNSLAQELLLNAVNAFSRKPLIITHFISVDVEGFEDDILHDLAVQNEMYLLKSADVLSADYTYRSFDLYATPKNSVELNDQNSTKYNNSCEKVFFRIARRECNECHQIISDSQHDECVSFIHVGKLIPFEDGEMEHTTQDDQGNTLVLVRYTCCPQIEAIKDDLTQGCVEVQHGNHKTSPKSDLSSWSQEQPTTFAVL